MNDNITKKPRLMYWEDAIDGWTFVPERVDQMISTDTFNKDGDMATLSFKIVHMTDEEAANLPEA